MPRHVIAFALLCGLLPNLAQAQDRGYFSEGDKQLVFKEEGSRSSTQRIVLASLFGGALLTGVIGSYYLLDSRDLSDELSASGAHTGKAWSAELEAKRKDALRSGRIATVSLGLSGTLTLAGAIAYIVTAPDDEVGYQDWQTRLMVVPSAGGIMASKGWSF